MYEIEFEIKGLSPLKMDKYVPEEKLKTTEQYRKHAEKKAYRNEKGELSIPSNALIACMREASSELGKKTEAKKNRQTIMSAVFIETKMMSLGKKDFDFIAEDPVKRGTGRKLSTVPSFRPQINEWSASGTIKTMVPPEFIKEAMELGGLRYGLLGYRPVFGRFEIIKWVVNDGKQKRTERKGRKSAA